VTDAAPDLGDLPRRYCPACEQVVRARFRPGPGGRPDARCPRCRSLERDRFFALLVPMLRPALGGVDVLLEISPSPFSTATLAAVGARRHVRLDIGYDSRLVDVLASLTDLPLPDASVDLLVCYHVLEHVPDDRRAMAEIARVLSPGGLAVVEVPWKPGFATDEDPTASEEERVRRFGQRDHVRYYGDDFEDRLREAGLVLDRVTPPQLLGEAMVQMCRLEPREFVWLVRRAEGPGPHAGAELSPSLPHALDAILGQLAGQHQRLLSARAKIAALEVRDASRPAARLRPARVVAAARRRLRARRAS
jgi:SAM-dependent methyltransferase